MKFAVLSKLSYCVKPHKTQNSYQPSCVAQYPSTSTLWKSSVTILTAKSAGQRCAKHTYCYCQLNSPDMLSSIV